MKMPKSPPARIAAALAVVAIAVGVAFATGFFKSDEAQATDDAASGPPPANVRVATAASVELAPHANAPGSVVSVNDSLIAAATPGKIVWIAEIGSELTQGALLARIDPTDAILQRDESLADIKRLSARAEYLARLVGRHEGLGDDGGESEAAVDQMRADRDEAQQNLARARVALRRAETALSRTEVAAPFEGRVVARETEIGEYVSPGAPIARLVSLDVLEVTVRAPDALLASVRPGDEITVVNGAESVSAKVRAVVPVGDLVSRTLELRLVLPATGWHIGSAVEARLPRSAAKRVVAVNRDALVLRADRISVFVIGAESAAKQVDVTLGVADGDLIEVIGDIKAGDSVVIRGGERLRDGQKVIIQNEAGEALS